MIVDRVRIRPDSRRTLLAGWVGCAGLTPLAACSTYSDELLRDWGKDAGTMSSDGSDVTIAADRSAGADAIDGSIRDAAPPDGDDAGRADRSAMVDGVDGADGGDTGADAKAVDGDAIAIDTGASDTDGDTASSDADAPSFDADGGTLDADVTVADGPGRDGSCTGSNLHDEDGDGVIDACDNCPTVANPNQANLGETTAGLPADGVGDACDPRPNLGGDSILFFDALTTGQLGSDWSVYAGTWVVGADTVAETAVGNSQEIDRLGWTLPADYLAETRMAFDALPSPDGRTTLPFRMDTAAHNGWGCAITNRSTLALSLITGGAAGELAPPTTAIPALEIGKHYRIQAGGYGSNLYCLLPDTGEKVTRVNASNGAGAPGLRTHLAAATFEYLLVYGLGGSIAAMSP